MVTIFGLALGACSVGAVDGLGDDDVTPDAAVNQQNVMTFSQQISPLVTRCTGCHGTTQDPNLTSFTTLKPKYYAKPGATNILCTEDAATPGMHQGINYLNTTEKTAVAMWIDGVVP